MELNENNSELTVKVPDRIEAHLDTMLSLHPVDFGAKHFKDSFMFIISKIIHIASNNAKFKNLDKVPISSTILMNEVGRHYRKYLDYLIQWNMITSDYHYICGDNSNGVMGKCICYGIDTKFKKNKNVSYKITKKSIVSKYYKWKETMFGKIADDELLSKLYGMISRFTVDFDSAKKYMYDLLELGIEPDLTKEKIEKELAKCRRINDIENEQRIFMTQDAFGRVHTNFTQLSRHIRDKFLLLDGEPVIGIDIVSSQASLLYTLLNDFVNKTEKSTRIIRDESNPLAKYAMIPDELDHLTQVDVRDVYTNRNNHYTGEPIYNVDFNPSISKFGYDTYDEMLKVARFELSKMNDALQSGIYEFFQDKWFEVNLERKTRHEMKRMWITYVFGKPNKVSKKMKRIWDLEFGLLRKIIDHFKKLDYRILAHTLQRTESDIVYNQVCENIDSELNIPYGTVHDSLIVQQKHSVSAKNIFSTTLTKNNVVTGVK
jgi:hypothetical protein